MRRFILLLLLIVLPIQFGMAAAADAREHVSAVHDHHAAASKIADLDVAHDAALAHVNCEACHFAHSLAHATGLSHGNPFGCANDLQAISRDTHASMILRDRPHRPKWLRPV